MKRTLVIHPKDSSTDFLSKIYQNKGWNVCTFWPDNRDSFKEYIKLYDRIIMLGHGTPDGLLNINDFYTIEKQEILSENVNSFLVIDWSFADILQQKETVTIWCNSDQFAKRYKLPGLHTGMIISEVHEAKFSIGCAPLNAAETLDNMNLFAEVVGRHIDNENLIEMQKLIREQYNGDDAVSDFNRKNIIILDENGLNI